MNKLNFTFTVILALATGFSAAALAAPLSAAVPATALAENSKSQDAEAENVPLNISIAETPDEFRCEVTHISDFDKVNESMASLKKAINDTFSIKDECVNTSLATKENQKNLNLLIENLSGGVSTIRGQLSNLYVESIAQIATGNITSKQAYDISFQDQMKAKEAVKIVVGSMKEINAMVEKNPLNVSSGKSCSTYYSSSERLVFGVAEMVEEVSPLLIQAVTKIPGLQELGPVVVGASMISSAITQYAQVAQKRVDINKPENRTAILVNTCQLVKTYEKMRMLRGLKNNPIEEKQRLNQMMAVQAKIISTTDTVRSEKAMDNQSEWIDVTDEQNKNFQSFVQMRALITSDDMTQVCSLKKPVLQLADQIISVQDKVATLSHQQKSLANDLYYEQIQKYISLSEGDPQLLEDCAKSTRSLYAYLYSYNRMTFQSLMDIKKSRIGQDKKFIQASSTLNFLRSFQMIMDQMNTGNLFEKLQASISKTEALVNQSRVLKAWFGNAKNFYLPGFDQYRNPVMDLMNYYEGQFLMFRKPFANAAADFDVQLYRLYAYWNPVKADEDEFQHFLKFRATTRSSLDVLVLAHLDPKNITTVTGRSSPHQKACTGLIQMRDNFRTMIEAFSTLKYFCQMLSPLLNEPEVSKDLRVRCLGVDDMVPNSPRAHLSGVDELLKPISVEVGRMPIVIQKIQELKCEN